MKKIIFLISGNGGNFKFFYYYINNIEKKDIKLFVITDRDSQIKEFCNKNKIDYKKIIYNKNNYSEFEKELEKINPDLIITNWHKIIHKEVVKKYANKMINLHYSLLPAFSGMIGAKTIEEAIKKKVRFLGATVHFVNEEVDAGEIISQGIIENDILENKEKLIDTIFRMGCLILTDSILNILEIRDTTNKSYKKYRKIKLISPEIFLRLDKINNVFWQEIKKR